MVVKINPMKRVNVPAWKAIIIAGFVCVMAHRLAIADDVFETRYQYYQEGKGRMRVDSVHSLFNVGVGKNVSIDGSYLYSTLSGASPTGLPLSISADGRIDTIYLRDERSAFSLGVNRSVGNHVLRTGFAYSQESDYLSYAYSVQDTISFNQRNTEVVAGYSFTDDTVGANGSDLNESKRSHALLLGVSQILGPDDLLSVNLTCTWRDGYLSDPYKRVWLSDLSEVRWDNRPAQRSEQMLQARWTHRLASVGGSVETTYRYGVSNWGNDSHMARVTFHKKFMDGRLIVSPGVRYYRQSAANFYDTEFSGLPRYYSADYRLAAEETLSAGIQARWYAVRDRIAFDVGWEHYVTRGLDGKTPQGMFPSATTVSAGVHFDF